MSLRSIARVGALVLVASFSAHAQQPSVGSPAPAVVAEAWLNVEGAAPALESLKGRVVLLEFWGTWCAPCVRAMPGIQKLHERYGARGLSVLAISYEPAETMKPFLAKHGYTMPVASDPERKTIDAYGIKSWPTTFLVDKEGKIAFVGTPYGAEAAVERALGLEAGPAALLDAYFDSLDDPKDAQRSALQRLVEKANSGFDLTTWARGHLPAETATEGAPVPASAPKAGPKNPAETLRKCAKAWGAAEQREPILRELGEAPPDPFDLAAFARDQFAKDFPLELAELKELLMKKEYSAVIEALGQRAPAPPVVAAAAKDPGLVEFSKGQSADARAMARQGLMVKLWVFESTGIKDKELNEKFFSELALSGMAMSPDKKRVIGVTLGGEMVMSERIDRHIRDHMSGAILMTDLGAGKVPRVKEIPKLIDQERAAIVKELEGRYGKPAPRAEK